MKIQWETYRPISDLKQTLKIYNLKINKLGYIYIRSENENVSREKIDAYVTDSESNILNLVNRMSKLS